MTSDPFGSLLVQQLDEFGTAILQQHRHVVDRLRAELADAREETQPLNSPRSDGMPTGVTCESGTEVRSKHPTVAWNSDNIAREARPYEQAVSLEGPAAGTGGGEEQSGGGWMRMFGGLLSVCPSEEVPECRASSSGLRVHTRLSHLPAVGSGARLSRSPRERRRSPSRSPRELSSQACKRRALDRQQPAPSLQDLRAIVPAALPSPSNKEDGPEALMRLSVASMESYSAPRTTIRGSMGSLPEWGHSESDDARPRRQAIKSVGPLSFVNDDAHSETSKRAEERGGIRFYPHEIWVARDDMHRRTARTLNRLRGNIDLTAHKNMETVSESHIRCFKCIMINPASRFCLVWSCFSVALLSYDSVIVPLDVGFQLQRNKFFKFMEMVGLCFWICDFCLNWITGVHVDGVLEMRWRIVSWTYLRGWFVLDTTLIMSELLAIVLPSGEGEGLGSLSMLRAVRFLRLARILRLARFWPLLREILLLLPDPILLRLGFLKLILALIAIIHVMACGWWSVGSAGAQGWITQNGLESEGIGRKYIVSVHWSVAQFHGYPLYEVISTGDIIMSSFCGVLGFIVLSACLSQMAVEFDATEEKQSIAMHRICRYYLESREVSAELTLRIRKFMGENNRAGAKSNLSKMNLRDRTECEEAMLGDLPIALQMDLYLEVRGPLVASSQVFEDLQLIDRGQPVVLRELCTHAFRTQVSLAGEIVFNEGEVCTSMLVMDMGKVIYVRGVAPHFSKVLSDAQSLFGNPRPESLQEDGMPGEDVSRASSINGGLPESDERQRDNSQGSSREFGVTVVQSYNPDTRASKGAVNEQQVEKGTLISQAALWTHWEHCGALVVGSESAMMAVDTDQFAKIICSYERHRSLASQYALCLVQWMNGLQDEHLSSDLLQPPMDVFNPDKLEGKLHHKDHFVFISHFKQEAGTEATLLEEGFERLIKADPWHPANGLQRPVFLDSMDLNDLSSLERYVRRSHNLILLLTPQVLTRPWCLLEILWSLRYGIEIVPVVVDRPGLSFQFPDSAYFDRLAHGKGLTKSDVSLLRSKGVHLNDLRQVQEVFQKIALHFSPHKSTKIREAELQDIMKRCAAKKTFASNRDNESDA